MTRAAIAARAQPARMPAFAPVERPDFVAAADPDDEVELPEVEVGSAVLQRAMSELCQATTTVGA